MIDNTVLANTITVLAVAVVAIIPPVLYPKMYDPFLPSSVQYFPKGRVINIYNFV